MLRARRILWALQQNARTCTLRRRLHAAIDARRSLRTLRAMWTRWRVRYSDRQIELLLTARHRQRVLREHVAAWRSWAALRAWQRRRVGDMVARRAVAIQGLAMQSWRDWVAHRKRMAAASAPVVERVRRDVLQSVFYSWVRAAVIKRDQSRRSAVVAARVRRSQLREVMAAWGAATQRAASRRTAGKQVQLMSGMRLMHRALATWWDAYRLMVPFNCQKLCC